jgi:formate dehydrogenase major subunit
VAKKLEREDNPLARGDPRFPHVADHLPPDRAPLRRHADAHRADTAELQPEGFAEIPTELARELGIATLDWVVLSTARGEIETRALVTDRLRRSRMDGTRGLPDRPALAFRLGGHATGDIANVLTAVVGDPTPACTRTRRWPAPPQGPPRAGAQEA